MATNIVTPTIEELQCRIAKLEKRVAHLEDERDHARQSLVTQRMKQIIDDGLWLYKGHYLPSESTRRIRLGLMTLEAAIADRDHRWPLFDSKVTLNEAYRMVV